MQVFAQLLDQFADNQSMVTPMGWRKPTNDQIHRNYNDYETALDSQCVTMRMPDWALRAAAWQGLDHSLEPSQAQWEARIVPAVQDKQSFVILDFFIGGQQQVAVDPELFKLLTQPFNPKPTSAQAEREALRNAIVL